MPGPPLSKTFTYDGTPGKTGYTRLAREMVQTQRFWKSKDTGTHARVDKAVNIPQNSQLGKGVGSGVTLNQNNVVANE